MSQKFRLVTDTDDDSYSASIQRHVGVTVLIVLVSVAAVVILTFFSIVGTVQSHARLAEATRVAVMTRTAMPTRTPRPSATPFPQSERRTAKANSALRRGPGLDYPTAETTRAGRPMTLVGRDNTGTWFLLDEGTWIAAHSIDGSLPIHLPLVTTR